MSENILNRIKLLMEYDTSKTLSDNNILLEQELEYDKYYKKNYLSKKIQSSLFDSVGVPKNNRPNMDIFRVDNRDAWYAVYAVWYAQEVEVLLAEKWQYKPEGACPTNWNMPDRKICKKNIVQRLDYNMKTNPNTRDPYDVETICYSEQIFYYKPYDNITFDSGVMSTEGKLSSNSFKRYKGHIPSYSDVIKCYGPNYLETMNKIRNMKGDFFYNRASRGQGAGQQSVRLSDLYYKPFSLTSEEIHQILGILEIATAFIPVAGPVISAALGTIDASMYYAEGDTDMGLFMLVITILPELKIATNITKSVKLMKGQKSIEAKILAGKELKELTKYEKDFIESLKTLNPKQLNKEISESIGRRADYILQTQKNKLTSEQTSWLKKYSKIYNQEFFVWDMLVAAAAAAPTNVGQSLLKKLSSVFEKHQTPLDEETAQKLLKSLSELDSEKTQEELVTVFENNKKEFEAFVKNPEEITQALKSEIKLKKQNIQTINADTLSQYLSVIPDDFN